MFVFGTGEAEERPCLIAFVFEGVQIICQRKEARGASDRTRVTSLRKQVFQGVIQESRPFVARPAHLGVVHGKRQSVPRLPSLPSVRPSFL